MWVDVRTLEKLEGGFGRKCGVSVYYIPTAGIAMDPTGSINWRSSLSLCTADPVGSKERTEGVRETCWVTYQRPASK